MAAFEDRNNTTYSNEVVISETVQHKSLLLGSTNAMSGKWMGNNRKQRRAEAAKKRKKSKIENNR